MYSVTEAAKILGVSSSRVRKLIADGKLKAKKIGNAWVIEETDVMDRITQKPNPGKIRRRSIDSASEVPINMEARRSLYEACKDLLSSHPSSSILANTQSSEEASFYMAVADFFLQQKQAELIKRGVF